CARGVSVWGESLDVW
nr:immunoglobulin heavy chain junction region [Macaca mulatta]